MTPETDALRRPFLIGALAVLIVVVFLGGLISLFGRAGRILSLAFVSLQVVAAGVLVPAAFSPDWLGAVSSVLPLSAATQAMQGLVVGQNAQTAIGTTVMLLLTAAVGIGLTVLAGSRARRIHAAGVDGVAGRGMTGVAGRGILST